MKKTMLNKIKLPMALMLSGAVVLSSCSKKKDEQIAQQSSQIETIQQELAERDSTYNELIGMLNKAEEQVAEISRRENLVVSTSGEEGKKKEGQLLEELQLIDELVKESNASIQNLKAQLKKSNVQLNAFQNRIDKLSDMLDVQKETITQLRAEVASKNQQIELISTKYDSIQIQTVDQKQLIAEQTREIELLNDTNNKLNKVHYAVGTFKELKEKGLVDKEGGFLWIGRTIDLKATANTEDFVETDIREFSELKIDASKFELVTEHPKDSYTIVQDEINENVKYLKVTDAKKFWEISNYLVVTTKG
ncbi:hypothetical protein [Roseivirga thermotolerans]|uniref:Cbp1 family collagen-binding glycoprotein adhesin n=1 Tax=Roseivirga thermotolerans TaxID=1758176 RepID=UPI00273D4E58|nr:hypothetical protein [Roseivirga thermotolerans]